MASRGKRVGPKRRTRLRPSALLLSLAVTLAVVAWGYLVRAAIDFGIEARSGDSEAWLYLAMACLGAVACLFIGLMLVARLLRVLGITSPPGGRGGSADSGGPGGSGGSSAYGGRRVQR